MKRLSTIVLSLVLLLSLVACGSDEGSLGSNGEGTGIAAPSIVFEEITVVDDENCTIKITGIDPDNMWGFTLNTYLENKSTDTTYMFSVDSASVNGVSYDPYFASEVAAGKKSNEEISFSNSEIDDKNIGNFTDIELSFRVYNSNDWSAEAVVKTSIHVYPYGEDKATVFQREAQSTDTVLVDNEYVTVIVTDYDEDGMWGYTANLFLVNKTDVPVMYSVSEASINGYMADPFYATSVAAGKCAFSSISWSDDTLAENNITEVETIEFILRAYNETDWTADDFVNEQITLNP